MRTWLLSLVVSMLVLVPLPAFAQGINLVGASVEIDGPRPFCFELSGKPVMRSFAITLLVDLDATGRIDLNDKVLDRFPRGGPNAGFLVQLTSKVDADFALVRVFYRKKVEAMSEPLMLNHTEVVSAPMRGGTVMLDPFPTKQADVQSVVVTRVTKTHEETFATIQK